MTRSTGLNGYMVLGFGLDNYADDSAASGGGGSPWGANPNNFDLFAVMP